MTRPEDVALLRALADMTDSTIDASVKLLSETFKTPREMGNWLRSLASRLEGERRDGERDGFEWLPPHKCGLFLEHNAHRDYHESVEQWDERSGNGDWVSDEERAKAIANDEVWTLQWYPITPIGFHRLVASSLDALQAVVAAEFLQSTPTTPTEDRQP